MIRTWHRAAAGDAAPLFDPDVEHEREELLDPLFGPVPTWRMTESPLFDGTVVEHGDPAAVDERVVAFPPAPGGVVEGDAVVVDPDPDGDREVDVDDGEDEHPRDAATVAIVLPPTMALPIVELPRRALRVVASRPARREPRRGVA